VSKYVIFSFDDGRVDTYKNAFLILEKFGMKGTINVVTDFVLHPENYECFKSCLNHPMSVENIHECQNAKWEIACHGSTHKNTVEDIKKNIAELATLGINIQNIGFASPHSELDLNNIKEIQELVSEKVLLYIRSGIQVRKEGVFYAFKTILNQMLHNKKLFHNLNKRCIMDINTKQQDLLWGIGITSYTTVEEIVYLIRQLEDGQAVILMFHSVLEKGELGYGIDKWYWDKDKLFELCKELQVMSDIHVCTTKEWVKRRS